MQDESNGQAAQQALGSSKKPRGRSPSYPGIDLEKSLTLAKLIYELSRKHPAPLAEVWKKWGMRPKTGTATVAVAALKKFGLVEITSDGVRLSELALDIIMDERPDSQERANRIREAALKPLIHSELWMKYWRDEPGVEDGVIRFYLTRQRNFTENGADDLIQEFKKTIRFSGLRSDPTLSDLPGDKMDGKEGVPVGAPATVEVRQPMSQPASTGQGALMQEIQFSIPGPLSAMIRAPRPLTDELWTQMIKILEAMKPTVVEPTKGS